MIQKKFRTLISRIIACAGTKCSFCGQKPNFFYQNEAHNESVKMRTQFSSLSQQILTMQSKKGINLPALKTLNGSLDLRIRLAAQHWLNTFQTAENDLQESNQRYIRVKFEDFLLDPDETVRTISNFCELEPCQSMFQSHNLRVPFSTLATGKIKVDINRGHTEKKYDKRMIEIVNSIAGDYISELGYSKIL